MRRPTACQLCEQGNKLLEDEYYRGFPHQDVASTHYLSEVVTDLIRSQPFHFLITTEHFMFQFQLPSLVNKVHKQVSKSDHIKAHFLLMLDRDSLRVIRQNANYTVLPVLD